MAHVYSLDKSTGTQTTGNQTCWYKGDPLLQTTLSVTQTLHVHILGHLRIFNLLKIFSDG